MAQPEDRVVALLRDLLPAFDVELLDAIAAQARPWRDEAGDVLKRLALVMYVLGHERCPWGAGEVRHDFLTDLDQLRKAHDLGESWGL